LLYVKIFIASTVHTGGTYICIMCTIWIEIWC